MYLILFLTMAITIKTTLQSIQEACYWNGPRHWYVCSFCYVQGHGTLPWDNGPRRVGILFTKFMFWHFVVLKSQKRGQHFCFTKFMFRDFVALKSQKRNISSVYEVLSIILVLFFIAFCVFCVFLFPLLIFSRKINFLPNIPSGIPSVSKSLEPDQAWQNVRPDLVSNCDLIPNCL